jgi:hypothetical protein
MKIILDNLFTTNQFEKLREEGAISFYQNRNVQFKEYYLIEELSKQDFLTWNEVENSAQTLFEQLKGLNAAIAKNTSLILVVKADNFQADLPLLKNKILQVEEDAFNFKKYVIVYTENSVQLLETAENISENLKAVLLNATSFNAFKENMCADEQYLATIQLFLKLPFLPTPVETNTELASIESLLNNRLSSTQKSLLEKLVTGGNIEANLNWQEVKRLALLQDANEDQINQFLSNFEDDAQA